MISRDSLTISTQYLESVLVEEGVEEGEYLISNDSLATSTQYLEGVLVEEGVEEGEQEVLDLQ